MVDAGPKRGMAINVKPCSWHAGSAHKPNRCTSSAASGSIVRAQARLSLSSAQINGKDGGRAAPRSEPYSSSVWGRSGFTDRLSVTMPT